MQVQSWVGKIPWRRKWQTTPVFLPWRPAVHRDTELDETERLILTNQCGLETSSHTSDTDACLVVGWGRCSRPWNLSRPGAHLSPTEYGDFQDFTRRGAASAPLYREPEAWSLHVRHGVSCLCLETPPYEETNPSHQERPCVVSRVSYPRISMALLQQQMLVPEPADSSSLESFHHCPRQTDSPWLIQIPSPQSLW